MSIVCIGEMLIDFVCTDKDAGLVAGANYIKKSGGAPANVAATIAKLGGATQLLGAVGKDPFGQFLIDKVAQFGVDTSGVAQLSTPTTLAFVSLAENGEREFVFNRGADELYAISRPLADVLKPNDILHLGSATALLGGELGKAYQEITDFAQTQGNTICFDPNYRIDLWQGRDAEFKSLCEAYFAKADIVKVSDEELTFLSGSQDYAEGCAYIHQYGVKMVLVTLGAAGCFISQNGENRIIPAYKISAVDTTGAGDSFIGALLYKIAELPKTEAFYADSIDECIAFAGKVSGLVCSKIGAMSALPSLQEVEAMHFEVHSSK